jgi:hypothetical protein
MQNKFNSELHSKKTWPKTKWDCCITRCLSSICRKWSLTWKIIIDGRCNSNNWLTFDHNRWSEHHYWYWIKICYIHVIKIWNECLALHANINIFLFIKWIMVNYSTQICKNQFARITLHKKYLEILDNKHFLQKYYTNYRLKWFK